MYVAFVEAVQCLLEIFISGNSNGKIMRKLYLNILKSMRFILFLRIDNSGWSVNSSALFDVAGMRWYQRKYHVLYTIRQPIINSIY